MNCNKPIPKMELPDISQVVSLENNEVLVDFHTFSKDSKKIYPATPIYYLNKVPNAINQCYVRLQVAKLLLEAANLLPSGLRLKIYDGWRPFAVQRALYMDYFNLLANQPENIGKSIEELNMITTKFVSYPSDNPEKPFVHSTGGAVDLTIVDEYGNELDMGTRFDDFSELAYSNYFEENTAMKGEFSSERIKKIQYNRRLLFEIMTEVGFTNLPSEWWHFDYGDQFWSFYQNKPAFYQGILKL